MKLEEFLRNYRHDIAVMIEEEQVEYLKKFKSIAVKRSDFEGIFVSDCYVGFTDSYRLLVIECNSVKRIEKFRYSVESIELLNRASEMAVLKNGTMIFNVKGDVILLNPINTYIDIRKMVIEYKSNYTVTINLAKCFASSDNEDVWKLLAKTRNIDNPAILKVCDNTIDVVKDFDNGSYLGISIPYKFVAGKVENVKLGINPKFLDVWFKNFNAGVSTLKIKDDISAILFQKNRLNYLIMPMAIR